MTASWPVAMAASAAAGAGPAIETTELSKRYGSTVALAGLTMRVERGEVFGFLGPNGAGKTTAVKLLLGLSRPTGGSGQLLGAPLGDRVTRRRVGYLPELFRYQPWMRARDVLRLHCELAGLDRDRWPAEIDGALRTVGLADRATDLVGRFSKGMQQRLGLGVALLGQPDVVFLDEPTSALDPVGRVDVRTIIAAARERGATVFLNSHLLTEVERVCDRVAIVDRGRVVAHGRIDELLGESSVRLRVTGLDEPSGRLATFGPVHPDGEWVTIRPIDPVRIPELVEAIVRAGGHVHAVEPGRGTLEDRFLALFTQDRPS
jgi:ABC-2 type transport system ATP-binding protein